MEAAPRLPMVSFELKVSTENVSFGSKLKQYIASFYHEDPESYNNEIHNLESLRSSAVRPGIDVTGCDTLKQYYCQLKFLKSRFPMEKGQPSAVSFSWKDLYSGISYTLPDINFELNCVLHNIGALHTQLGATDTRSSSEGMKMSCTHFQCAAWAFQHLRENYSQMVTVALLPEVIHFMQQLCLAQAQECILEKSMMDNRKSTIIAKVAVQVVDYYNSAMQILTTGNEYSTLADVVGSRVLKDWNRYLKFKIAYHSCVSLLYQGQQAEEAQKMGERVAYYQAASEQLEEARKIAKGNMGQQQHEVDEALAFTQDVVEGKKKAAKNENEFIYHEVVPEKDALQQVNGASLVRGTPFSVNDPEVSGKDLFSRLVPMEAHEASSLYSEQKAEMIRQIGAIVETKDSELVEFMSSLQLDSLTQWRQAIGVPQDIVDRAAAICAKPQATQALVEVMGRLAGTCHEVESLLSEIQELIKEEEAKEQEYQKIMGKRPPSIVSTDLSREAGKYSEAHSKANESNQTLHRAMTMHMSNLKILAQPISELKKAIPSAVIGDPSIDEGVINELETLVAKVDEMRSQRAMLVSQLREAVCADDITALLVTKPPDISMEQLFQQELTKHKRQASLIEQNLSAQDNILSALTDIYAKFAGTRRYILEVLKRREATTTALIASYDAYDDLLAKANKGIEFYQKLEGNISKLQQRVKSACRVNEEEREQMLAKSGTSVAAAHLPTDSTIPATPKLKDYLASMKASAAATTETTQWVPAIRPTPLGQEESSDKRLPCDSYSTNYTPYVPQSFQSNTQYPYQPETNYYPSMQQTGTAASITANSQQYSYPDPNAYYSYNVPGATNPPPIEIPSVPVTQNYPVSYYQNQEQSNLQPQQNYQYSTAYNSTPDPKSVVSQNYQMPSTYYTATDAKISQSPQNYQNLTNYYSTSVTNLTPNIQQSYPLPANSTNVTNLHPNVQQSYPLPANSTNVTNLTPNIQQSYILPANSTNAPNLTPNIQQNYPLPANSTNLTPNIQQSYSLPANSTNASNLTPNIQQSYPLPANSTNVTNLTSNIQQNYSLPTTYMSTADTKCTPQYPQNYQMPLTYLTDPKIQQNYQLPAGFYQIPDSYTPSSTPQLNYSSPGIYSPSTDTHAPSQKLSQPEQPTDHRIQSPNYPTSNSYSSAGYQPTSEQVPTATVANNSATVAYSSSYAYPTSYKDVSDGSAYTGQYSQSYQAPNEEYQKQYQYVPQYYPTSNYQQVTQQQQPQTVNSNTSGYESQYNTSDTNSTYESDAANASNQSNYYSMPYGYQTIGINSMTMMHANNNSTSKSTTSASSNVDLLTGLDFSVSQTPLQPVNAPAVATTEQKPDPKIESTVDTPTKVPERSVVKKEEKKEIPIEKPSIEPVQVQDPLVDPEIYNSFSQEVDKLEKFVDALTTKTLNGPTSLDIKWKDIQEQQERDAQKCSISVARCYPMKNRFPDIMPYDHSRVELPSTKDDYINASHVKGISQHAPPFIVTQAPLKSTIDDFWTMVWEQQIEVIVCMLGDTEMQQEAAIYWPLERGAELQIGKFRLVLQGINQRDHWVERIISIGDGNKQLVVVHVQFTGWPGGGLFPTTVYPLISLANAVLACHRQQRVRNHPVLVHCLSGVGRSGVLCVLIAAMCDPMQTLDVSAAASRMSQSRKNVLRDREHLKFTYQAVLQHAKDLLSGRQLQAKMQNINIVADETSSRRSSASSEASTDQTTKPRKKFTPESFVALKEQGITPATDTNDPLSALDPLWTIRK